MPFTNGRPIELTPDFTVDERLANEGTLHALSIRYIGEQHSLANPHAYIEGSKSKEGAPQYSFGWGTHYSIEDAAKLILEADSIEGFAAATGALAVCGPGGGAQEYEWWATEVPAGEEEVDVADLGLAEAGLIRLDINNSTLGWNIEGKRSEDEAFPRMWVMSSESITTPWVQTVYDKTVEDTTRVLVDHNIGRLGAVVSAFLELPFGECTLDADWRTQAH